MKHRSKNFHPYRLEGKEGRSEEEERNAGGERERIMKSGDRRGSEGWQR